jgi:hypothetical protein
MKEFGEKKTAQSFKNTKVSLFFCFVRTLMFFDVSFLALAI